MLKYNDVTENDDNVSTGVISRTKSERKWHHYIV